MKFIVKKNKEEVLAYCFGCGWQDQNKCDKQCISKGK